MGDPFVLSSVCLVSAVFPTLGSGLPVSLLCSRNERSETPLVARAQLDHSSHPK